MWVNLKQCSGFEIIIIMIQHIFPLNNNSSNIGWKKERCHIFYCRILWWTYFFFSISHVDKCFSVLFFKNNVFFSEYLTSIIINAVNQRFCCMQYVSRSSIYDEHFICVYLYAVFQAFRSIYEGGHTVSERIRKASIQCL